MGIHTEEQLHWKSVAHKIAEDVVRPGEKYDELQEYPWDSSTMAKAGLRRSDPEGVARARASSLCLVIEELSRACGGVGVAYAVNASGVPHPAGGTEE